MYIRYVSNFTVLQHVSVSTLSYFSLIHIQPLIVLHLHIRCGLDLVLSDSTAFFHSEKTCKSVGLETVHAACRRLQLKHFAGTVDFHLNL